ncbi:MAG TPA: DMT family transporter [Planctomycetota bacterium]|nr:DMT family transporter [Planctomycetota bacterium]
MNPRVVTALSVTILLWASAFAAIRMALGAFSPGPLALFRFAVASAALALYGSLRGARLPRKEDLPALALCGLLGVAYYHVSLNYGQVKVKAGVAAFLINTSPIFTALLARFYLKEKLRPIGWIGMFVSVSGVVLLALKEGQGFSIEASALLIVSSAVAASIYTVRQKSLLEKYTALEFTTYACCAGTFFMLVFLPRCLREMSTAPLTVTLAVVYLGLFPAALGYACWSYILSQLPASTAVSYMYIVPVMAMAIAWIFLDERPGPLALPGGVLALLGVILVQRYGRVSAAVPEPAAEASAVAAK